MSKRPGQRNIMITNLLQEKEKFFSDTNYNPQFEYDNLDDTTRLVDFGMPEESLYLYSKDLIEKAVREYGSLSEVPKIEGNVLTFDDTKDRFQRYLHDNNVASMVEVEYFDNMAARTSTAFTDDNRIIIKTRLPVEYREGSIKAVLDHEIGTHAFRWINEVRQPWYDSDVRHDFNGHLKTEEGLATLHWLYSHPISIPLQQAIYYYVVYRALSLSFAELYKEVLDLVGDREFAWFFCVRAKRGMTDTSLPGAYTKDIVYLQGIKEVSMWLDENNYNVAPLYLGKIAIEDIEKCLAVAGIKEPLLPLFVVDSSYPDRIASVIAKNDFLML